MILIAYDDSPDAKYAIEAAAKLFPGSTVTVVTVWHRMIDTLARSGMDIGAVTDYHELDQGIEDQALSTAGHGAELAAGAGLRATSQAVAVQTTAAEAIIATAAEVEARAIVLGTRGLSGVKSWVLGSVSSQVLHHSDRPVLVVPSPVVAAERAARD